MLRLVQERIKTCGSVSAGDVTTPGRSARNIGWFVNKETSESALNKPVEIRLLMPLFSVNCVEVKYLDI